MFKFFTFFPVVKKNNLFVSFNGFLISFLLPGSFEVFLFFCLLLMSLHFSFIHVFLIFFVGDIHLLKAKSNCTTELYFNVSLSLNSLTQPLSLQLTIFFWKCFYTTVSFLLIQFIWKKKQQPIIFYHISGATFPLPKGSSSQQGKMKNR